MQTPRLVFLLAGFVERRYLLLEDFRHRVLLSTVAVQAHEREEAVRLSVFRFAVREAGKPSKPPPVRRAGVSVVPLGQCLRGKGSEELRKRSGVLEPGLKVAGAGLDNVHLHRIRAGTAPHRTREIPLHASCAGRGLRDDDVLLSHPYARAHNGALHAGYRG